MVTIRWLFFHLIMGSTLVHANDPPAVFHSKFEVQRHLFGDDVWTPQHGPPSINLAMQKPDAERKSVGLAAIYSLLLPGMGELYADGFGSGKYFLIAEGALWLTYAAFDVYGSSLQDDARAFAVSHAGVDRSGKDDQYYVDIGNFLEINQYNEKQLRDREPERLYDPNAGFAWRWESDAARVVYREQRISSENMFNNRRFVVGAILINHIASAINAARSAISHNKNIESGQAELSFKAEVMGGFSNPHGILLTVTKGL